MVKYPFLSDSILRLEPIEQNVFNKKITSFLFSISTLTIIAVKKFPISAIKDTNFQQITSDTNFSVINEKCSTMDKR